MIHLENIHSLSDFQRNTREHIRRLKKSRQPVVLTINGQSALVVQSAEAYQALLDEAQFAGHIQALRKSLNAAKANRGRPVRAVIEELARQHDIKLRK
ncbi:MAG: type II toxin-antitoxin system Phd/YefM family antitoxin [Phycisphaerae bacterium]